MVLGVMGGSLGLWLVIQNHFEGVRFEPAVSPGFVVDQ
jgi:hypothetical protein